MQKAKPFKIGRVKVGMVAPISVKDAISNPGVDPEARSLAEKIMSGEVVLCAPFPGMDQPLSPEKIKEFEKALDRYSSK